MKLITDFVNQTLYQRCKNSRGWLPLHFILCTYYRHLLPWLSSVFSALSVWSNFCVFMPAALSMNPPQVIGHISRKLHPNRWDKTSDSDSRVASTSSCHMLLTLLHSYSSAAFGPLYDPFFLPHFQHPSRSLSVGWHRVETSGTFLHVDGPPAHW